MPRYYYQDRVNGSVYQTVTPFRDADGNLLTRVMLPNGHPGTYCVFGYGCVQRGVTGQGYTNPNTGPNEYGGTDPTNSPSDWELP